MAQAAAVSAKENAKAPTAPVPDEGDAETLAKLQDFLKLYNPPAGNAQPNMLQDRYKVETGQPLPAFDSRGVKAYQALDTAAPDRRLIALVCQPGNVIRYKLIEQMKTISNPALLPMVAFGVIEFSQPQEERFVVFFEHPEGMRLSEFLSRHSDKIFPQFILERIITPLASAINALAERNVMHGSINSEWVFIKTDAVLMPNISEPSGYSQAFYNEPLERIQCSPAGKSDASSVPDYYALAVLTLYIMHGSAHFTNYAKERLAPYILREGAYTAVTRQKGMPEVFYDFLRGVLSQHTRNAWTYEEIKPWLEGKRYNVLPPPSPVEAIRPFEFGGYTASNRRELAHIFATHWEQMCESLQSGHVGHWAAISLRDKELCEQLTRIGKSVQAYGASKQEVQRAEQCMFAVLLLDPDGPVRLKNLAFDIDAIPTLYAELFIHKSQDLNLLIKFIELNMQSYWLDVQNKQKEVNIPPQVNNMLVRLDRIRTYIRNNNQGFGPERVLYDLNPDIACQSEVLSRFHVTTLQAMLKRLDRLAPALSRESDPLDRHMSAFLTSKLGITSDIKVHELSSVPALANNRAVIALYLLSMAQQKCSYMKLPGLTHWLAMRIYPLMDDLKSRTLRRKIKEALKLKADSGDLVALADLVIGSDYANADKQGFAQAWKRYRINTAKIASYKSQALIDQQSKKYGYRFGKMVAYAGFLIILMNVMR